MTLSVVGIVVAFFIVLLSMLVVAKSIVDVIEMIKPTEAPPWE